MMTGVPSGDKEIVTPLTVITELGERVWVPTKKEEEFGSGVKAMPGAIVVAEDGAGGEGNAASGVGVEDLETELGTRTIAWSEVDTVAGGLFSGGLIGGGGLVCVGPGGVIIGAGVGATVVVVPS